MTGLAPYRLPAIVMDATTASSILTSVDAAISRGCSVILYGHDIQPGAAALTMLQSEWDLLVTGLKYRESLGLCDVGSFSDLRKALGAIRTSA